MIRVRQLSLRVSVLVELLVVSSREFSFFFTLFQTYKKSQIYSFLCFPLLCFHRTSLFILCFPFFSFFKTLNNFLTKYVNQPVKLLSPPVLVDSTYFSLYAITKVSRKPKHTHFKYRFQNIHFLCAVLSRSNFGAVAGDGKLDALKTVQTFAFRHVSIFIPIYLSLIHI